MYNLEPDYFIMDLKLRKVYRFAVISLDNRCGSGSPLSVLVFLLFILDFYCINVQRYVKFCINLNPELERHNLLTLEKKYKNFSLRLNMANEQSGYVL